MLWLALFVLTVGAVAAIVVPLIRPRTAQAPQRSAFDRAIYRDQLAEIARDVERGVLDADQVAAARLEIERRLLATEESRDGEGDAANAVAPIGRLSAAMLAALVSAGSVAVYLALGSPGLQDQPLAARHGDVEMAEASHGSADLAASVVALAAKLEANPDDAEGWLLLARSQAELQRWPDSAASYRRAMALTDVPEASAGYGEMQVMAAEGIVTPGAREAFNTALASDPTNLAARFYLALGDAQAGKAREAIEGWRRIIAESPPNAPWLAAVREQMDKTAQAAGIELPKDAPGAGGPRAADVAAAQAMSPEERQKMIRGMVEGLAARLAQNPDDAAGWRRLAKAYGVLGDKEKATEAAARAAALQPDDVGALLDEARAELEASGGTNGQGRDPRAPLPEHFVALMKRIAALDPRQPDALWYLGLAEAQQRNPEAAAGYWRRLLETLKPESEAYKTVKAAADALKRPN